VIYALDELIPQLADDVYVAPNATVIGDVILAAQVSVWFGAVLRGDVEQIVIGRGSNIQDNSVLHSDPGAPLSVGELVTVGHMVTLHGCSIGHGTLIGMGASVLNHARIGRNCLIGAHALITEGKEFPDGMLIVGSPARAIRPLTAQELEGIAGNRQRYIERANRYRTGLQSLP
jgi:carbonic anhydrase/acetyltransferase-like protein (isoleucine patch superfamily)